MLCICQIQKFTDKSIPNWGKRGGEVALLIGQNPDRQVWAVSKSKAPTLLKAILPVS